MWVCSRLKGSADKIQFPAVAQNTNPYTILSTFLVILGKKLDLALSVKDTDHAVLFLCVHMAFISHWPAARTRFWSIKMFLVLRSGTLICELQVVQTDSLKLDFMCQVDQRH